MLAVMRLRTVLAGVLSALVSLIINNTLLNVLKQKENYAKWAAPVVEEILKTLTAKIMGVSVFYTHVVFGMFEAYYDWSNSSPKIGVLAGLTSLVSHGIFGYITVLILEKTGSFYPAVMGAVVFHVGWNAFIIDLLDRKSS